MSLGIEKIYWSKENHVVSDFLFKGVTNSMVKKSVDHIRNGSEAGEGTAAEEDTQRLIAFPLQLIETRNGVILRRGSIQVEIAGERALPALQVIFESMGEHGATKVDICSKFAAPDHPAVMTLIEQLMLRQFVIPVEQTTNPITTEGPLDVFYWHFGASTSEVNQRLNRVRITIIGVNHISCQLARSLISAGMNNIQVVDYPLLRNLDFFEVGGKLRSSAWQVSAEPTAYETWEKSIKSGSFDCLVATSDFGGLRLMRKWNTLCLEYGCHFLPVVLQDMVGYIGPSVIPGETACFECLLARLDSNYTEDKAVYLSELMAFEGQSVTGFHPSMASILGDLTTVELTKFYSRVIPLWKVGSVMEVNLLAGRIDTRKVLRVPRCSACSNLIHRSSVSIIKDSLSREVIE